LKKGLVILVFLGVVLAAFVYMSPVTPEVTTPEAEEETHHTEDTQEISPEQQVDEALRQLTNGEIPPMQGILKIRDVADKYPGNVKANFTLGTLSMQTGQYDKAIERFQTVLEKQPENGQVWKLLAQAHLGAGDTTQAKQSFDKALDLVDETTANAFREELKELKN
jgi:cytochrome c-type biogenesis protein CcmH/NrfG